MAYIDTIAAITGFNIILALSVYFSLAVGQFSLAQVGFWAIGAYGSGILTAIFGWPLLPSLLAVGIVCGALGVLLGYPCLRIHGIYLALATLGFSQIVAVLLGNLQLRIVVNGIVRGPEGLLGFRNIPVLTNLVDIAGVIVLLVAMLGWITSTRLGKALAAIREDSVAAGFAGINVVALKVLMFALGAAVAGIGGGLYANYPSYISAEDFNFHQTLFSLLYVAVGGVDSFIGPVVGAILLTTLPEYVRFLAENRSIFYGVVVLAIMVWRPRGLIDRKLLRRALAPSSLRLSAGSAPPHA